jgi:hypothetical protein
MNDLTPAAAALTAVFSPVPATPASATPAPTAPTAPAVPLAQTVAPPVEPHSHSGLSPSEAATMASWIREDVTKGKLTPEAAAKIFDDLGTPGATRHASRYTHRRAAPD